MLKSYNFDYLAPFYQMLEYSTFGRLLEQVRYAYTQELLACKKILLLGDGDGRFLIYLLQNGCQAQITYLEGSSKMITCAKARLNKFYPKASEQVTFIQQKIENYTFQTKHFDVVVAHFFLDCFPPKTAYKLIQKIQDSLLPDGIFVLSDFYIPPKGWQGWRAWVIVRLLYWGFRILTGLPRQELICFQQQMKQDNWTLQQQKFWSHQLLKSELWKK